MPKKVSKSQIQDYLNRMQEIVKRTAAIDHFVGFSAQGLPQIIVIEVIFLQLRRILELIATALLTINPDVLENMRKQGKRTWHALDILRAIEDFNPDFYPKPTKPGRKDEDGVIPLQELRGGYLTKEQFTTLYTRCSRVLHTPDPFSNKQRINLNSKKDFRRVLRQLRKSQSQIIKLLTHHQFVVKDDETMYIAHTVGTDFTFHVAEFEEYEPRASC